jgi:hypothetical protein
MASGQHRLNVIMRTRVSGQTANWELTGDIYIHAIRQ